MLVAIDKWPIITVKVKCNGELAGHTKKFYTNLALPPQGDLSRDEYMDMKIDFASSAI